MISSNKKRKKEKKKPTNGANDMSGIVSAWLCRHDPL